MVDKVIRKIKNNTNIVEIIGVISLTKNLDMELLGSVLHSEKTPSFSVVEDKQFTTVLVVAVLETC